MSQFIEGRRAVREALDSNIKIFRIVMMQMNKPDRSVEKILVIAKNKRIRIDYVNRGFLDKVSSHGSHQGIMAEVPDFKYTPLEHILEAQKGKQESLILVLDHITDEGNLGSVIRSAEIVGASGIVIPTKRAAQVGVGVYKTSAGAALHIPIARVPNIADALGKLKSADFWVAGASEKAKQNLWSAPLEGRIALVMGSEGEGISRLVSERCDFLVKLPQRGKIASLNVAQAATALMYEWLRRSEEA